MDTQILAAVLPVAIAALATILAPIIKAIIDRMSGPKPTHLRTRKPWLTRALATLAFGFSVSAVALSFIRTSPDSFRLEFFHLSDHENKDVVFVENQWTDKDRRLSRSDASGVDTDCTHLSPPPQARGAIVMVWVASPTANVECSFIPADATGKIDTVNLRTASVTNSFSNWMGFVTFCPFYKDKTFKWTVVSKNKAPDDGVACVGRIIGWF